MRFFSLNNTSRFVSPETALFHSLPPDKGLYVPERLPQLSPADIDRITNGSLAEIGFAISKALFGDDYTDAELADVSQRAFPFDTPVVALDNIPNHYVLELFHGPSLAFKDVGARYMAAMMGLYLQRQQKEVHILVATSGDTGGAVAMGFHHVPGVMVSILYPRGRVSLLQEKQLTTLGGNIRAFEVDGSFDDCQAMVKAAFVDEDLNRQFALSSANSINIFRLIPQSFYYFRAYGQLKQRNVPVVFSVPSGNFGNLSAGVLAQRLGLPIHGFVAATNVNDVVPTYLHTGQYAPKPSVATLSNAMDVGDPSNFPRLLHFHDNNAETLRSNVAGYAFTDSETEAGMRELYERAHYVACPHTAVGYLGAKRYRDGGPVQKRIDVAAVTLATAHPSKFNDSVERILGQPVDVPERLAALANRPKQATALPATFGAFKEALLAG